ncbi:universal stress protein [Halomicroarcula sp. S1AR25-4]|uniref:universal stress protein n=1 Tax=unclassified Haloarcula TaxID=2624677 RepID=UPI00140F4BBE|nr:universal stress protein [Halomicroarcula sp. S1AR25-4]MDS0279250.1 universal stress protein [Halomicroarcula sp. S1AR25-4]QIO21605.1 universal stress protein [Haloarcula sp. JP-L23]
MFDTVVIATDGSGSAERAVEAALDLAAHFDATVHALYVVDSGEVESTPEEVRTELERALATTGGRALSFVREAAIAEADSDDIVTAVRQGDPADEICQYAIDHDADVVATGTRGRHGEHGFLLGSVAEEIVRQAPMPVLSVRQLEGAVNPEREQV